MGEVAEEINKPSFVSSTNWTITKGSLSDSISFETPISSINDEEEYQDDSKTLKQQQQRQFVVLNRPSSSIDDSTLCEIKLSFEQRHEIRQVYVRSTARIFEIYYEMAPESSNEYLCTVRCGLAAKEEMPLGPNDTAEATSAHSEGSDDQKEHPRENVKSGSNGSVDEDGWVEVNVPTSALLDSKGYPLVRNINRDTVRSNRDFYEATAEITDSNPCISITLRLLSLHTQGCIHLEEIYIFGEPVGPSESDVETDPMKSTTVSSMMAMLVPTLLQISKTGSSRITQDDYASDVRQELKHPAAESVGHCVGSTTHEEVPCAPSREEVNMETVTKGNPEAAQMRSDEPVQGTGLRPGICDHQNDSPSGRMERVLDQLVGRVCRIEAFCSRFEENMLKPISNIETRLERLEQQLETLTMRSQISEFYPHTRISAPDFSCIESETNSLAHDENENSHYAVSDIASKDAKFDKHPKSFGDESESSSPLNDRNEDHCRVESESLLSDACESVVAPRLFPCLIVTAPEFSNKDDDDDYGNIDDGSHCDGVGDGDDRTCSDDFLSSKTGCPSYKPSLTLDDALAMALTGFMTSSSDHAPKSNNSWTVEAPDFPDETNDSNCSLSSPLRSVRADSRNFMEVNGAQNSMTFSLAPYGSYQDNEVQVMRLTTDASTEAVDGSCGDKSVNQSIAGDSDEEEREVDASQGTYASCEAVEGSCGQKCANPPRIAEANDDGIFINYIMKSTTNGFAAMNTSRAELQVPTSSNTSSTEAVIRECQLLEEGLDESSDEKSVNQTITANSDELTGEVSNYKMEETSTSSEHDMLNMNSILSLSRNSKEDMELLRNPDEETMFDQNFIVDFELPILDVKFTPVEHSNSRCSIESLLSASANDVGNPCTQDDGSNVVLSEEEDGSTGSKVDRLLVDVGNILKNTDNSSVVPFFAFEDFFINKVEDSCAQEDSSSVVVTGQSQVLLENESNGPEDANQLLVEKSDDTESNFQSPGIDSKVPDLSEGIDSKVPDLSEGIGSKIPDCFEISSYI